MKKNLGFLLIFVLAAALFTGCGKKPNSAPQGKNEFFSPDAQIMDLVGGTLADVFRQYGTRRMYFEYNYGFFCPSGDGELVFFLDLKSPAYTQDPIDSYKLELEEDAGYYYDFDKGDYKPGDFIVQSVMISGETLQKMFGGKPAALDTINEAFGEPYKLHRIWELEYSYLLAGPFALSKGYISFKLDGLLDVEYAKIDRDFSPQTFDAYFQSLDAEGNITLAEDLSDGMGNMPDNLVYSGVWTYTPSPELRAKLKATPPEEGALYYITVNEANEIINMELNLQGHGEG